MAYTLSYYRPVVRTIIAHPPWWKFWQRSKLKHEKQPERVTIYDVSPETAQILMEQINVIGEIIPDVSMVQLEQGPYETPYIKTTTEGDYAVDDGLLEALTK